MARELLTIVLVNSLVLVLGLVCSIFTFVRRVILMTVVELNLSEPLVRVEVR
jgi:hypothetical protein